MSKFRRQISYNASLSIMIVTSVCSSNEWTHKTVLYGSTTAVATCGTTSPRNMRQQAMYLP